MTKQNEQEALGTAMNKTEMFFEKNSKSMIIALLALFVLAAAIFGYRQLISQPRERKAAAASAAHCFAVRRGAASWKLIALFWQSDTARVIHLHGYSIKRVGKKG